MWYFQTMEYIIQQFKKIAMQPCDRREEIKYRLPSERNKSEKSTQFHIWVRQSMYILLKINRSIKSIHCQEFWGKGDG